ncbi:MAG: TetR family transcriptional regulator [Candidatus Omnitrophica bacterium]|nr:TetR family transcriptional regulator [Candidatus Omnitrophota bacterium]MCB9720238.1 TetR family transcriptional regulator [Candidatus Omnitrophota bacterium]
MKSSAKTAKAAATRDSILGAARDLFREQGFEPTTMRAIAAKAGVALGSAYYYFKTKDELVLAFYARTQQGADEENERIVHRTDDFRTRLDALLTFKFRQMRQDRGFVSILAKSAADPDNPLSPFSPQTRPIRMAAIKLIEDVISGSNIKVHEDLRPCLAKFLWLYQMGLMFFWIQDRSANQRVTAKVKDMSLSLIGGMLQMTTLPLMNTMNDTLVDLLNNINATLVDQT